MTPMEIDILTQHGIPGYTTDLSSSICYIEEFAEFITHMLNDPQMRPTDVVIRIVVLRYLSFDEMVGRRNEDDILNSSLEVFVENVDQSIVICIAYFNMIVALGYPISKFSVQWGSN